MMRHFLTVLFFCLSFTALFSVEKNARLQYISGVPVYLESEALLEISQSLPGLGLSTVGKQNLKAVLTMDASQTDFPVSKPPFDLTFLLKALKISLRINNEALVFDTEEKESSLYLSQMSKIIDRPIKIHFDQDFELKGGDELKQAIRELPVLQEINPQAFLADMMTPLFALAGEDLTVGKVVERQFETRGNPSLPNKIVFTVTAIDDYNIYADIKGYIEKKVFNLVEKVKIQDRQETIGVSLKGGQEGKGKWNRDNGMLADLEIQTIYTAMFNLGKWEWMLNGDVKIHTRTRLEK